MGQTAGAGRPGWLHRLWRSMRGAPRPDAEEDCGPRRAGSRRPGKPTKPRGDRERDAAYELRMHLKNCYGIGHLDHTFRFPDEKPHVAIYASNGTMKSSLAKTLAAIATDDSNSPPRDDIHPERSTVCNILYKNGKKIDPQSILVIKSYENTSSAADMSTGILVDPNLRDRHRSAVAAIIAAEKGLLARLSDRSGVKAGEIEGRLLDDLGASGNSREAFYSAVEKALEDDKMPDELVGIKYQTLFNTQTDKAWSDPDFAKSLNTYIETYDMLLKDSPYLSRKFDHTGAGSARKALNGAGFFQAEHVVGMKAKGSNKYVMKDSDGLGAAIDEDMERIKAGLRAEWEKMDKALARNTDVRILRGYLSDNKDLIPRLGDIGGLKRDIWGCYIAQESGAAKKLADAHHAGEKKIGEIVEAAGKGQGKWEEVIEKFHSRFDVPFRMRVDNKPNAVIGIEAPRLMFTHHEKQGDPGRAVERDQLDKTLSTGEKKAFFTLNALFSIQEMISKGRETLVVLDDIVDSFDYKNKYAVVEYLKDLSDNKALHLLILTHNFDFFRTIESRWVVSRSACHFVERDEDRTITVKNASPLKNPLFEIVDDLGDRAKIAAAIPFARNIVEYTRGKGGEDDNSDDDGNDNHYAALSNMLHWREGKTDGITIGDLDRILRATFNMGIEEDDCPHSRMVWEVVDDEASRIASSGGEADLYGKVALSIAIRMRAERFVAAELAKRDKAPAGKHPKTHRMIADYKKHCAPCAGSSAGDKALFNCASQTLDKVTLMTPEIIHLNSFMYEPILDMSGRHLSELYIDVRRLGEGAGGQ